MTLVVFSGQSGTFRRAGTVLVWMLPFVPLANAQAPAADQFDWRVDAAPRPPPGLPWSGSKAGKVHIAGSHLKDSEAEEFNLPVVRRECAGMSDSSIAKPAPAAGHCSTVCWYGKECTQPPVS